MRRFVLVLAWLLAATAAHAGRSCEQHPPTVQTIARDLVTASSPRSIGVIKRQVYQSHFQSLAEAWAVADTEMVRSFGSEDFKEGVAHFLEKRPAAFTGR